MPDTREPHDCHDCGAEPGGPHEDGCDVARCMWTGGQAIQCDGSFADVARQLRADGHGEMADRLSYHLSIDDEAHDCGQDIWTGIWPGVEDCQRLGFWCYFKPDYGEGNGWERVPTGHPRATEDLNRLQEGECTWDREAKRWEARA